MSISFEEEALLNEWGQKLCPGFRLYRHDEFTLALEKAINALADTEELLDRNGDLNLARMIRYVITRPERDGYGVPFPWWWIFWEANLLRGVVADPWGEVKWWLWDELRGKGQILTMWGCQNSGKTSFDGRFAVCQMAAWIRDALVYVAGPEKLHTDDKAWASLKSWVEHLRKHQNDFVISLGIECTAQREGCFIADRATGERAAAKFVALEAASSVQGKKSAEHEESGMTGITLLIIDEFIENPNLKIKQAEGNIASNFNFFGLLGCNPLPEKVQHPAIRPFSEPVDVMNLRRDTHFRWRTAYGMVVRFAWLNCPNRLLGRSQWPYLLTTTRMERARRKGSEIIDSQVDAWGWGSGSRGSPLDEAQIRMAGTYQEPQWTGDHTKFLIIDCAFGGEDPATACILEAGEIVQRNNVGDAIRRKVISGLDQIVLPVDSDFHATQEWIEEMEFLMKYSGGGFPITTTIEQFEGDPDKSPKITEGMRVGGGWHLAYQVLRTMEEHQIPRGNVTFDSSQRGDATTIMLDALGRGNVRWWYEGSRRLVDEESMRKDWFLWPYVYEDVGDFGEMKPKLWSQQCSQVISMIWFFGCEFIKHGYLVNGGTVQKGLTELTARPVVRGRHGQGEGKKDVLGKEKLKEMGMKSPTWGETLAIGIYFGVRFLGMVQLEGPKLATSIVPNTQPGQIIRANKNLRFSMNRGRYFPPR